MARLAAVLLVLAACKTSAPAPAPAAPAPAPAASHTDEPPDEVAPPDEETDPEDYELADGNADDGSNPEETADDAPPPTSAIPKEEIRRVVARHRQDFARCYEAELANQPSLQGRVETSFVVGPDGSVVSARATGLHPAVETCLVTALRAMRFPRPTGGGSVTVTYPFNFASAH